jgi:hypothetical protein
VKDLCRRAGISTVTFYKWKTKFERMEISEIRRLRLLEEENTWLKKIAAQQALDIDAPKVVLSKKVVGPQAEREAVRVAREEGKLSERRSCGLMRMNRGSWQYQPKDGNETVLRRRLRELAVERPPFGYRRLHRMLRREKENGAAKWTRISWLTISQAVSAKKTGPGQNPAPGPVTTQCEMPSDGFLYCWF